MCDAIDFFAVSLTVSRLTVAFGQTTSAITTSITLTLLFRPVVRLHASLLDSILTRKHREPSSSDSPLTDSVASGLSSSTSFSSLSSRSELDAPRLSSSSLPSGRFSESAWEVSGASTLHVFPRKSRANTHRRRVGDSPLPLHSRICPRTPEASSLVSYSRVRTESTGADLEKLTLLALCRIRRRIPHRCRHQLDCRCQHRELACHLLHRGWNLPRRRPPPNRPPRVDLLCRPTGRADRCWLHRQLGTEVCDVHSRGRQGHEASLAKGDFRR
jgi:hypothetical protein